MKTGWAAIALVAIGAAMQAGCGSTDGESLSCGPGTAEQGGQCVSVGAGDGGTDGSVEGGAGGAAGADAEASAPAPCGKSGHCPTVAMAQITEWPEGIDGEPFEIDAHEVTNTEYDVFLKDAEDGFVPAQSDERCGWNVDYARDEDCRYRAAFDGPYDDVLQQGHPVVCIDWCDAQQYCAWAGKRLCRSDGKNTQKNDAGDPAKREWVFACTGGANTEGTLDTPYEEGDCTWDNPCENYPGVFNMPGGVNEFVDYCWEHEEYGLVCDEYGTLSDYVPRCDIPNGQPGIQKPGFAGIRCCR